MSDAYGSFENPYGAPPPFPHQLPPGTPPPPPSPYLPPGWPVAPHDRRPAVVVIAAVIAIVLCVLSVLALLLTATGIIASYADPGSNGDDALSTGELVISLGVVGVAVAVPVFAIVLSGLALARRQWARVVLVILGFLAAGFVELIGVSMIVDGLQPRTSGGKVFGGVVVGTIGLLPVLSAVLLLLPPAGRWYRSRRVASVPFAPPTSPPPGPPPALPPTG